MPSRLRNVFINILLKKCPRCQRGDLFTIPLEFTSPLSMPKKCPVCFQDYEPEPGFYYGAMFISYILSSFVFLGLAAVCIIFLDFSVNQTFALIIGLALVGYLWLLRISRSIWIHFIIKFDPNIPIKKPD